MPEKKLIVVVGGLGGFDNAWRRLEARLKDQGINGEWYFHHTSGPKTVFRGSRVRDITKELLAKIDSLAEGREKIILVGHSAGGMIVRDAYLLAAGAYPDHPDKCLWWDKVESILLFASINRGFRPYARTSWALGLAVMKLISLQWLLLKPPPGFPLGWLMELERGSFFVTDLRLAWMRHFHEQKDEHRPFVVQFLGDIDGVVAREDVRDTEAFVNSYTVTIKGADHINLFDPAASPAIDGFPKILEVFQNPDPIERDPVSANALPAIGPDRVIFILHGIRDGNSGWVTDIAEAIERMKSSVAVDRSTYGWFSTIKFALPWVRRKNLSWFLDRYSYHIARNPRVRFHFIGHSNGTYILGISLLEVSSLTFDLIYLAGSVLPREFPWSRMLEDKRKRVATVVNQCSSKDWPVGWLCRGLHWIGFRDVGTGGFDGFDHLEAEKQTKWFKGNHGKPLQRPNQPNIINYVLSEDIKKPLIPYLADGDRCPEPSFWFKVMIYLFPPILATFILLVGVAAWFGWTHGHPGAVILGAVLLYFLLDTI